MRDGWRDKEAAPILGVHPAKVSQSLTPALRKIARLMQADPLKTLDAIREAMADLPDDGKERAGKPRTEQGSGSAGL